MSTYTDKVNATPGWPLFAVIGTSAAAVLTAVGTFTDLTDNETGGNDISEYLPVLGIIAVGVVLVFGLIVRTAHGAGAGTRSLALGIVGLLSSAVFWSGLPAVLAAGSVACALTAREETGRMPRKGIAALVLSAVTVGFAVWAAIAG
jgi:hypothetical protein